MNCGALLRTAIAGPLMATLALSPWTTLAREAASPARLEDVTVIEEPEGLGVLIRTSRPTPYRTQVLGAPPRVVIDLDDTVFAWGRPRLAVGVGPVGEVRGSQFRRTTARVVIELTRPAPHQVRLENQGLTVVFTRTSGASAEIPARAPEPVPPRPAPPAPPPAIVAQAPAAAAGPAPAPTSSPVAQAAPPAPSPADPPPAAAPPARTAAPSETGGSTVSATPPANGPRLISLDFKDADVVNLLRILAAESGRNIVVSEDVKGRMSITLRSVPWEQALETILDAKGLQRIDRDNVIRIVSNEQLARERELKARAEENRLKAEYELRTKQAEAQVKEVEALTRRAAAEAAAREAEARGPLREETIRLSYADPDEVARTLQGILGIPPEGQKVQGPGVIGGLPPIAEPPFSALYGMQQPPPPPPPVSVSQDVLTKGLTIRAYRPNNTIFLRLYAADLERIKKLIRESLDVPLPQVKIEARMEILDRTALEQIGVQWGGFVAGDNGSVTLVGQGFTAGGPTGTGTPVPVQGLVPSNSGLNLSQGLPVSSQTGLPLGGNIVNLPISTLPNAGPLPTAGIAFGIIGTRFNIHLALQALAEQGKTRTLARPEIVTVENNKAVVELGEEIPYATVSSAGTQIAFKKASLKLEVTPTVIRDGAMNKIKMVVIVENNSRGQTVNLGTAGQPPAINTRKAETQVLIKEGDRLIIGGVATASAQRTERKVPVLGDIPVLGRLFRIHENFDVGRELVVFVTPTVLRTPATPANR